MTSAERHEFNNVLAALMAEAQLLQMDALPPDQSAGVDRIVEHARKLNQLFRALALRAQTAGV